MWRFKPTLFGWSNISSIFFKTKSMPNYLPTHHLIKYLLTFGILIYLGFLLFDYKKELLLILDISALQFSLISALILAGVSLNGSKLNQVAKTFEVQLLPKEWFALSSMTTFFNNVIYKAGSIATSKYLKSKHNFSYLSFAAAFACDQLILLFVGAITGSIISFYLGVFNQELIFIFISFAMIAIILFFLYRLKKNLPETWSPVLNLFKKGIQSFNYLLDNKNLLCSLITHNIFLVLTIVFRIYVSCSILHLEIPLSSCALFTAVIIFSRIIPITINDIGLREFAVGFLSSILGSGLKAGVLITSVDRVFEFTWAALFVITSKNALINVRK